MSEETKIQRYGGDISQPYVEKPEDVVQVVVPEPVVLTEEVVPVVASNIVKKGAFTSNEK